MASGAYLAVLVTKRCSRAFRLVGRVRRQQSNTDGVQVNGMVNTLIGNRSESEPA
jgi:ribosomal protein L31E